MITIKNVRTLYDQIEDYTIPSSKDETIEAQEKLLLLPGLIDPHICFGSINEKNRWELAITAAIKGGITTIVEIPEKSMPCNKEENVKKKRKAVDQRLFPLHYFLYANADLKEVEMLALLKKYVKGIVIQPDENQIEERDDKWDRVFQLAAWENLPMIINPYPENIRGESHTRKNHETLLEKAIHYSEKQSTRLYVLNVSTREEIEIIQEARKKSLLIYAETTPQHLFRQKKEKTDDLWEAIHDGVIETLGSGYHVDYPSEERVLFKGGHFSLSDPLFMLPLLLNAYHERKISLEKIVHLTYGNIRDILEIEKTHDVILVDLEKEEVIQKLDGKHSVNLSLKGWPIYTIIQGHIFPSPLLSERMSG